MESSAENVTEVRLINHLPPINIIHKPSSTLLELLPLPELVLAELPAVAVGGAHHVVLLVAVVLGRLRALAPELLALLAPGGTVPVEAEPLLPGVVHALHPVLDEEVGGTLPGVPRAVLVQVTLPRAVPTEAPAGLYLNTEARGWY